MLKKLICWAWGHKTVHKAYTGEQVEAVTLGGIHHTTQLYRWEKSKFCIRCGKEQS